MTNESIADAAELVERISNLIHVQQPLFEAEVNDKGQIVIVKWVRERYKLNRGDKVAIYRMEKVWNNGIH